MASSSRLPVIKIADYEQCRKVLADKAHPFRGRGTLIKIKLPFPMNSFRLKNMETDNIMNLEDLYEIVGEPPFSRKNGIKQTLEWLKGLSLK